jgi:hypothetical protein
MQVGRKSSISAVAVIQRASAGLSDGIGGGGTRACQERPRLQTVHDGSYLPLEWAMRQASPPPAVRSVELRLLSLERGMRAAK